MNTIMAQIMGTEVCQSCNALAHYHRSWLVKQVSNKFTTEREAETLIHNMLLGVRLVICRVQSREDYLHTEKLLFTNIIITNSHIIAMFIVITIIVIMLFYNDVHYCYVLYYEIQHFLNG